MASMAECDHCGSDVVHVWKHRRAADSMTYRTTEWLCSGCHPEMSEVLAGGHC